MFTSVLPEANQSSPLRLVLIDRQLSFRELLAHHLEQVRGSFSVVGQGETDAEALILCQTTSPHLLLLDESALTRRSVAAIGQLTGSLPALRILLISTAGGPLVRGVLEAGAHGCVSKQESLADFCAAIMVVALGGGFHSALLPAPIAEGPLGLTPRQVETLTLIANGHSTKEVAAKLNISFKTADHHRTRLMRRLGVHDVASLVRLAIRAGLVE